MRRERPAARDLLIVTGMSGAGRNTVANSLEDHGWFVIANLPTLLVETLTEVLAKIPGPTVKLAVVIDVRSREVFQGVWDSLRMLDVAGISHQVLFLDADDETLLARFEKEKRPHPMQGNCGLAHGLWSERAELAQMKATADIVLDTTNLNIHELATTITEMFSDTGGVTLQINVMSFGFKYGLPLDADHVADVRFLPNPHWVPELRASTGLDGQVRDYVLRAKGASEFLTNYVGALNPVFAGYRRENKHYVTIALGCTGGRHRSVAMAHSLAAELSNIAEMTVSEHHRDVDRDQ